jgi:hypothetical protein
MIFSCIVPFESKEKKIPDLSLPPCILKRREMVGKGEQGHISSSPEKKEGCKT